MSGKMSKKDYEQLNQVTNFLTQQADATRHSLQRMKQDVQDMESRGWVKQGASIFFDEIREEVFPAVESLLSALDDARQVAESIRQFIEQARLDEADSPL